MSLRRWFARQVSFFSRLARSDRLAEVLRKAAPHRKRPDTKLTLEAVEGRENPLPVFLGLQNPVLLLNLPLVGLFKTPDQVLLTGWDTPGMRLPPAQPAADFARPDPLLPEALPRDGSVLLAGLLPPQQEG